MTDIAHKIKAIRAIIAALGDAVRDLENDVIKPMPHEKRLSVPWVGQNTSRTDDDYSLSDCGAACLAMVINSYRAGNGLSVDDVSRATGRPRGYTSLSFQELISAAAHYSIALEHVSYTLENICADIDAGKPVIVLVNYKSLPTYNRYSGDYNGGHYIVVTGYDAECMLYHDPYWPEETRGAYRAMTRADFERAYTTIAPGNTRAPHALRVK